MDDKHHGLDEVAHIVADINNAVKVLSTEHKALYNEMSEEYRTRARYYAEYDILTSQTKITSRSALEKAIMYVNAGCTSAPL